VPSARGVRHDRIARLTVPGLNVKGGRVIAIQVILNAQLGAGRGHLTGHVRLRNAATDYAIRPSLDGGGEVKLCERDTWKGSKRASELSKTPIDKPCLFDR
jgi:hypothetical protein